MTILKKICCILMLAGASAAQATPLAYNFNGPTFTNVQAPYTSASKITGKVGFDSALLDANGNGNVYSYWGNSNPGFAWSFEDGFNRFDNLNTIYNFHISLQFTNFAVTGWYLDTTYGWTYNDIFVDQGHNHSMYRGVMSYGPQVTAANWSKVPEPGSIALMGLGMAGLAGLRRRKLRK